MMNFLSSACTVTISACSMHSKVAHLCRGWWRCDHRKLILETLQHVNMIYCTSCPSFHCNFQKFKCVFPSNSFYGRNICFPLCDGGTTTLMFDPQYLVKFPFLTLIHLEIFSLAWSNVRFLVSCF